MRYLLIIIFLAFFSLSGNIPNGFAQFSEAYVQEFNTPVEAPDFTLQEIDGNRISMKDFKGKVVLLNFFTTW